MLARFASPARLALHIGLFFFGSLPRIGGRAGWGGPVDATSVIDTILDRSVVLGYGNTGFEVRTRLSGWPADRRGWTAGPWW
jgi:hypothetical protein